MLIAQDICDQFTDKELVEKSLVDIDFFSCLYERFEPELLRYINRITSLSNEEVEDVLQEAFIKIWRNLNDFDHNLSLSSWIYRIVHNETISFWRKRTSGGKNQNIAFDDHLKETISGDANEIENKQDREQAIYLLLEHLPINYKTVLVLKFLEGMSYQEVSDILKIPEGTVATRINRAKKAFAKIAKERGISFDENFQNTSL